MIDDYLERRPERLGAIERLARSGRLSVGPWVTQMDEFLTSGESHIRNLEMGLARARELAGDRALDVGYMPDQFGHIGQMPQILRAGGLERAMVWRGVPESIDRTTFWWESPDGSRVLTEYMVFGYFNGESFDRAVDPGELADRSGAQRRALAALSRRRSLGGDGGLRPRRPRQHLAGTCRRRTGPHARPRRHDRGDRGTCARTARGGPAGVARGAALLRARASPSERLQRPRATEA